jgi:broad specificity phosphatase PhoE
MGYVPRGSSMRGHVRTLFLIRHAPTAATRAAAFSADEPLDERGREQAAAVADVLPARAEVLSSPLLRARQTAEAAGLDATVEEALAEVDIGSWAGRTLAEVNEADPAGVAAWMTDPDARPHGGESLRAFSARVAAWVDAQSALSGRAIAITHSGVVKAALVHTLGAPFEAFWRIDVSPLAITELHGQDGRWTITRVNCEARSVP